ncbi:MAG: DNA-3-methyladenine glycosylase [Puniceicoccales bacterium]|nr:DNA-3-methyladenine glycosylase [Puniceicoccales bacterium]
MTLFSDEALDHLRQNDPLLGKAIDRFGKIEMDINPDPFAALIRSIAGQQISGKAAETVWNRLSAACHPMEAVTIHKTDLSVIQSCGMSLRKAEYIRGIADRVVTGALDLEHLKSLPDQEILRELTTCRGVGPWTAEMLLIFSYQRPDIVSCNDLGIRLGMVRLYGLEALTKAQFQSYRERYTPHGTVASFYLWALANLKGVDFIELPEN